MGIREVSASSRSLIPLNTKIRYTTMILLPDDEEILDVVCGDKDFWVISATQNIAHVKPAKEGASTNLNLVTASGTVYSFLLSEKAGRDTPDLKVYVNADPRARGGLLILFLWREKAGRDTPDLKVYVNADPSAPRAKPKYYSAAQVDELQSELTQARAAVEAATRHATEAVATYQQQYPG